MDKTRFMLGLADVLEIENLLSAYLSHIQSYSEKEEFFERMRLAQEARLESAIEKLNSKLERCE